MKEKIYKINDLAREIRLLDSVKGIVSIETIERLQKLGVMARKHRKLCENYCNMNDFDNSLIDQLEEKIRFYVSQINIFLNILKVEFQRDPRGLTCKFTLAERQIYEVLQ